MGMTLRQMRQSMGLSQPELDRRAGLTKGTVSQIEVGTNQNPSIAVCLAIVGALREAGAKGVDVEMLFSAPSVEARS